MERCIYEKKSVPVRGIEPRPRRWERRILTTRPRGSWCSLCGFYQSYSFSHQVSIKAKEKMFSPGIEPGTLCVWSTRDNHYTTRTTMMEWNWGWEVEEENLLFPFFHFFSSSFYFFFLSLFSLFHPYDEKEKKNLQVLPGFEPGTFCVLGRCDNHYTTAPPHYELLKSWWIFPLSSTAT